MTTISESLMEYCDVLGHNMYIYGCNFLIALP